MTTATELVLPPKTRSYLLQGLASTPEVISELLKGYAGDWNRQPDPERFTLRESLAHMADYEDIFLERIRRTVDEDSPILPDIDEGALAVANRYADFDPAESVDWIRRGRKRMVDYLESLGLDAWSRVGTHTAVGPMSVAVQAVQVLAHDMYHIQYVVDCKQ